MIPGITSPCPFVFETPCDGAFDRIAQLYRFAQETTLPKITRLIKLHKDECKVHGEDDPLELMKFFAKGLAYSDGKVYSITPETIHAFGTQLPNGRIAIFGLAIYPDVIETKDGPQETPWKGVAHWSGSVCVCKSDQAGRGSRWLHVESARLVASLLSQARHLGILKRPAPHTQAECRQNELMACL